MKRHLRPADIFIYDEDSWLYRESDNTQIIGRQTINNIKHFIYKNYVMYALELIILFTNGISSTREWCRGAVVDL